MKKTAIFLLAIGQYICSIAQNVFPSSGNVGIGVSAPAFPLDVKGYTHSNVFLSDAVTPGDASFFARGATNGNANIIVQGGAGSYTAFWLTAANGLFKIGGTGGAEPAAGVVNITWDGKVGIGLTSPQSTLHLNGTNLGTTGGNLSELAKFAAYTSNYSQLRVLLRRASNGTDWLTTATRIQATTDATDQGYIDFNPAGTGSALGIGFNNSEFIRVNSDGTVGIGTTNTGTSKLAVEGALGARSVKVTLANPWPDFVFYKGHKLCNLVEVENYIKRNNHLPGIPSQREVAKNGVDLGEISAKLLEKVEELTLYLIELKKENAEMRGKLTKLITRSTGNSTARGKRCRRVERLIRKR